MTSLKSLLHLIWEHLNSGTTKSNMSLSLLAFSTLCYVKTGWGKLIMFDMHLVI